MQALPIDPLLPEIARSALSRRALVLVAEPGAGKTTRVPPALLDAGVTGEILVLEPRRLAARLAARRVAAERGERVGETVGYQVRFEEVRGPRTRLMFLTEGVLTRRLLSDPTLRGVGAVLLDEFHERHLQGDLALALLARMRRERPELIVGAMSATMEAEPVARYLDAPVVRAPGRPFEVSVEYLPAPDERALETQVASALRRLLQSGLDGDVLVFLPGAAEIRRAGDSCREIAERHDLEVLPLHGELSPEEQDRAVEPGRRRKVVLSTNVAETSVTLPAVVAVIDSGLARAASHSPWSGLPSLRVQRVSRASAEQRAGRAGRTRPGRCLRLFTRADFEMRPDHEAPEIARMDLAETVLALHGSGVRDVAGFAWFEDPPPASLGAASELLSRLGAVDAAGALTETGRRMLRWPVHPRQARVLLEAQARGVAEDGALVAALLGEREIRREARGGIGGPRAARVSGPSDVLESLDAFRARRRGDLDEGAARAVERAWKALLRASRGSMGSGPATASGPANGSSREDSPNEVGRGASAPDPLYRAPQTSNRPGPAPDPDAPLLLSILAGYPDRVAQRRAPGKPELILAAGGSATLADSSVVKDARLLVALEAEERGPGKPALVRSASAIEADWLLDLFPDSLTESDQLAWNDQSERVERTAQIRYGQLVLEESKSPQVDPAAAAELLTRAALARGPEAFTDPEALAQLLARTRFAASSAPDAGIPALGKEDAVRALAELCQGCTSFAQLREASLTDALRARLGAAQSALDRVAPERIQLPGGRSLRVHYEEDKPPWIESRLQDFFGMAQGPRAALGRVPLVLHLLAPNQRAVQVTTDLAGFWDRHYPAIRKELMRKYPRHAWPEDPRTAQPPAPKPPRYSK